MDPTDETSFGVTLSSRSSTTNRAGDFTTHLSEPIVLQGEWQVALTSLITDHDWINIPHKNAKLIVYHAHPSGIKDFHLLCSSPWLTRVAGTILAVYKDTPASPIENNYLATEVPIRSGYYATPGEIGDCIARDVKHLTQSAKAGGLPFYFKFERNERSVHIYGPAAFVFVDADPFLKALGIETPSADLGNNMKLFIPPINGKNGKVPGVIDTLYIYSELLVERNYVGDAKTSFLTAVPVSGQHGDTMHYEPINPEYKKVLKRKEINEIDIQIRDVFGEPIPYQPGTDTAMSLRFKRVEQLE